MSTAAPGPVNRGSDPALSSVTSVRIRPAHEARLLELSATSALVEAALSLAPERVVVLELRVRERLVEVRGRVVRGYVAGLGSDGAVRYRGLLSFDDRLDLRGMSEIARK